MVFLSPSESRWFVRKLGTIVEILLAISAVLWLASQAVAKSDEEYIQRVTIHQQNTWDAREIKFIELRFPGGGSVLVSGDKDLELTKFLERNHGSQLILTFNPIPR